MMPTNDERLHFFAVAEPGLVSFVKRELIELNLQPIETVENGYDTSSGGVSFTGDLRDLYRASIWLRTASRILVRAGEFVAAGFSELRRKTHNLSWEQYLRPKEPITFRVTSHASKLYVKASIAQEVCLGIADRLGTHPVLTSPDHSQGQLIILRMVRNYCTVSVDSSGEHLHRRGYRLATAKAPLRETLAASMLLASRWDTVSPLLDPFCGSGTIPIEAALLAHHIPPGRNRHFRFQEWPGFNQTRWEEVLEAAESQRTLVSPLILASDRDAGALRNAGSNAKTAGVAEYIAFSQRAVSDIDPPPCTGWVVTNPPYGRRTKTSKDLRNLYDRFGDVLRSNRDGRPQCSELMSSFSAVFACISSRAFP
ncbi:MAG TPA: class I SAM-dependent RNA methyltransferase [Thermodesulfobacteriota bacterium]|nr:class I SAM-dependent RNA methyltransferase [Deltaproteobacteria bacterium]HQO77152.1 class I SAM-dependent RNA methyltransferase [Thermodesulfobacteriota bacterium]